MTEQIQILWPHGLECISIDSLKGVYNILRRKLSLGTALIT